MTSVNSVAEIPKRICHGVTQHAGTEAQKGCYDHRFSLVPSDGFESFQPGLSKNTVTFSRLFGRLSHLAQ